VLLRKFDIAKAGRISPQLAGDEAYRRFCRPELSHYASPNQAKLQDRARVHLKRAKWFKVPCCAGAVQAYEFLPSEATNGQSVLLVHGWTSEAAFMAAFVEPLLRKGFRIVAFDLPAHGFSAGRHASLIDSAQALHAVAAVAGPFDHIVCHSLGGVVALMVADGAAPLPGPIEFGRYVLIATPNKLTDFTANFARQLRLPRQAQRAFEHHLERIGHRDIETVATENYLPRTGRPTLIVHARDDEEVPFSDAEAIIAAYPRAEFLPFAQFGHAGVLYAPPVVRAVRAYLLRN